jgi:hypothetical protein
MFQDWWYICLTSVLQCDTIGVDKKTYTQETEMTHTTCGEKKVISKMTNGSTMNQIEKQTKIKNRQGDLTAMINSLVEKKLLTRDWNNNGDPIYTRI